jgi:hypothetical protein
VSPASAHTVYVSPVGIAHWPDPIGILLVTACQGVSMRWWRQAPAERVKGPDRCRSSGCERLWAEFDERRRRFGGVTDT